MKHIFSVTGMTCDHCEKAVQKALRAQDQQAQVLADRNRKLVEVQSELPREVLSRAITDAGYTVTD